MRKCVLLMMLMVSMGISACAVVSVASAAVGVAGTAVGVAADAVSITKDVAVTATKGAIKVTSWAVEKSMKESTQTVPLPPAGEALGLEPKP